MIPLAAYTAAETLSAFQWVEQPKNCPFLWGISTPSNMFPWAHPGQTPYDILISSAVYTGHVSVICTVSSMAVD